jgi:hypothetical protein
VYREEDMGKEEGIREGDIEALRRRKELEGRPIKSTIVRDKDDTQVFYEVREGKVEIREKL